MMQDIGIGEDFTPKKDAPVTESAPEVTPTADATPGAPKKFDLPDDVETLARMRDQLEDYLAVLELNTETIGKWLTDEQDKIILANHRLYRAIAVAKNEQQAVTQLSDMGEIA